MDVPQGYPENPLEAVTLALYLALTAPTEKKSQECATIAQQIADDSLSKEEVELAKATALTKYKLKN